MGMCMCACGAVRASGRVKESGKHSTLVSNVLFKFCKRYANCFLLQFFALSCVCAARQKEVKSKIRFVQSLFDFVLGRIFPPIFTTVTLAFFPYQWVSFFFTRSHLHYFVCEERKKAFRAEAKKNFGSATKERSQRLINSISTTMSAVNGREKIYLNLNNKFKSLRFIPW